MGVAKLQYKTGFRSFVNPGEDKITSVYSIMGVSGGNVFMDNALFLYRKPDTAGETVKVSESTFIGVACPEHFNLTNRVKPKGSSVYWQDLTVATPVPDGGPAPWDEEAWKQVNDAEIPASECSPEGLFVSPVKVVKDLVPGINSDRTATDTAIKALVDGYRDCVRVTTSMDTLRYPEGYDEAVLEGSRLRITLQTRVTSFTLDSSNASRIFIVTAFVKEITDETGAVLSLPKNMFLTVKSDNTDGSTERLDESVYIRVVDPTDIQDTNPNVFGSAELTWGTDSKGVADGCLAAATTSGGTVISSLAGAETAHAPAITGNISGYYKSKVYKSITKTAKSAESNRQLISSAVRAFITKYEAQRTAALGTGYDYWESGDIS